ncbi:MAG: tRNA uridine-5-carboxymethylaminomethyl(34) synthesis GTPase MnmE [Alphaproteobacteria bacterium]|nr:tRNA uridine-5-carboxymethylaminomethyl(34) synthesis GTPase MnmE [Alphaproteobacteria bacterium]
MKTVNTIFALSSAYGKAGVSVFRISGPASYDILFKLSHGKNFEPNVTRFTNIYHPKTDVLLDSCMAVFFKGPASYTGEDTVELYTHGSIAVIDSIYEALSNFRTARIAEKGEFTKQAFLNNKLDLTQVEAIADLIEAETESQRRLALSNTNGEASKLYNSWREKLVKILAWCEASIDFSDDEMPKDVVEKNDNDLKKLIVEIEKHIKTASSAQLIKQGLKVAIIGKPNVGKSSIFNKIIGENKAIVSNIAGTTRDIVDASLDIEGFKVNISDTSGLNEKTNDKIEKKGIKKALDIASKADIKIYMIDGIRSFDEKKVDEDTIVLFNKIDKKQNQNLPKYIIPASVKTGENWNKFWNVFIKRIKSKMQNSSDVTLTQQRYKNALNNCIEFLKVAIKEEQIDLKAENLRLASDEIGNITGKIYFNELLDNIFSSFCLGK